MNAALCGVCAGEVRATCPHCGRRVRIDPNGRLFPHDTGTVHAGHMTWGGCPGAGKPVRTQERLDMKDLEDIALLYTKGNIDLPFTKGILTDLLDRLRVRSAP